MKLQRWGMGNPYCVGDDSENGEWCRAEDVAALEAENESLRAEIERLKAPPKVLEPEQVTKDGAYWFQRRGGTAWTVIYVFPHLEVRDGLYIGPMTPPEV